MIQYLQSKDVFCDLYTYLPLVAAPFLLDGIALHHVQLLDQAPGFMLKEVT